MGERGPCRDWLRRYSAICAYLYFLGGHGLAFITILGLAKSGGEGFGARDKGPVSRRDPEDRRTTGSDTTTSCAGSRELAILVASAQEMAFLLITAFVADDAYSFPGIGKMWVFHWPFCKDPLFLCFGFNFGIGGNVGFYGFRSVGSPPGAL